MKHVVSWSGGKDSTAMLLSMIKRGMPIDQIVQMDTGKEFPAMLRHIEKVKKHIHPLKVTTVKLDFDYWFSEHVKTRGVDAGMKGYGWPDFKNRWCTRLKSNAATTTIYSRNKYNPRRSDGVKKYRTDVIQYFGIAYDESKRTLNNLEHEIKYPLIDWKITGKRALRYCYDNGFYWEGLYELFDRVSCWCCPLSRVGELHILYNEFPELWTQLKKMDKKSRRRFSTYYTVDELEKKFEPTTCQ